MSLRTFLEEVDTEVLALAPRWNEKTRSLKLGDIVVIMDASAPRGSWPLGRILEVFPDKQGFVRSVKLQTKNN